jgi:hypothetical protein
MLPGAPQNSGSLCSQVYHTPANYHAKIIFFPAGVKNSILSFTAETNLTLPLLIFIISKEGSDTPLFLYAG